LLRRLSKEAHEWLNRVNYKTTPFSVIRQIFLLARRFGSNTPPKVTVSWTGDILNINSHQLDISLLPLYAQNHLSATETFFATNILKGAALWEPNYQELVDDYRNREDGYSFVTDPANGLLQHRRALLQVLMSGDHRSSFVIDTTAGTRLNAAGCRRWLRDCEQCLQYMFQDMILSWGVPSRATEIATVNPFNIGGRRSVFWKSGLMLIILRYHKGQKITGLERWVIHALPPRLSRLLALYLGYVIPTAAYMAKELLDNETSKLYKSFLFTSFGKIWGTQKFTSLLRQATIACFDVALGIQDWRHAAIAIGRKEFVEKYRLFENAIQSQRRSKEKTNIIDAAAAHTSSMARDHYAVPYDVLLRIPSALQDAFIAFSRDWFTWMGLGV
jgi:hypothetical protein